jgi:HK97 family phage portal protein
MAKQKTISQQITTVHKVQQILAVKENVLLNKALRSSNPSDIIKANSIIQGVERREPSNKKSFLVDPMEFNASMGYKNKSYSLSYEMMKRMSYAVPIIRGIIGTRVDQIASFCEPQSDKYSTGFIIRKKQPYFASKEDKEPSKEEMNKIEEITNFMLNCGNDDNFEADDFDTFVRKLVNDSLTYDQMTFEVVDDRRGRPCKFYAVDASSIRIADSYDDDEYKNDTGRILKNGYYPSYCQIENNSITADYYPWEMCFGVRNPTTNIYSNGYGVAEIEILVNTITSMLWGDEYNRRFFSQGSAPKGFFKIKQGTTMNEQRLAQFKQQWQSMMAGVYNSWKTPVLEGDIDWVDLQKSNQDMEFSKWIEYLIKLTCAIYRIDPAEINFPLSGGSEKPMFEGNNEARLKHSKDKGLFPILKFLQRKFNKYLVGRYDNKYEFVFCGMDGVSAADELEMDIKMMTNFCTIDEIRVKRGLKPLGEANGGNVIANSIWMQDKTAAQQAKMQEDQQQQGNGEEEDDSGFTDTADDGYSNPDEEQQDEGDNPFEKAFDKYLKGLR